MPPNENYADFGSDSHIIIILCYIASRLTMTTVIQLMKLQLHQLINWLNMMKKLSTLLFLNYRNATNIRVTSNEEPVHHIQGSVLVPNNEEFVTSVIKHKLPAGYAVVDVCFIRVFW